MREKAAEKLFHALGRLKRLKARAARTSSIGVGGCVAQLQGTAILERAPYVDVLVGTHNVARVPELVRARAGRARPCVDLDRKADTFTVPDAAVAHIEPRARLRHRHRGLQPRLQLLRRAAHARARGLPRRPRRSWPRCGRWWRAAIPR